MIRAIKNTGETVYMEWRDVLTQTEVCDWDGSVYAKYTPVGANRVEINPDDSYTIEVNDIRVLIDTLSNGGVSLDFKYLKVVPSRYLKTLQGYNSIILYKGWFCRVDSCGSVILCKEQEAYDRGLLAK